MMLCVSEGHGCDEQLLDICSQTCIVPAPHQAETDDGTVTANCADLPFQSCYLQTYQGPEPGRYLATGHQEAVDVERGQL